MTEIWIAGAGLALSVILSAGGIVWRLAENKAAILDKLDEHKEQIDDEVTAIRISSYEEYKILRKEMVDSAALARKEFGETIHAIREKVVQVELWIRDELKVTRHNFQGSVDMRYTMALDKLEEIEERLRFLELFVGFGKKTS